MKKKTNKTKYTVLIIAVIILGGYMYVEAQGNTVIAVFDNTSTTTAIATEPSFDDEVTQYVTNSVKMVKALKDAKDTTSQQAEVLARAETAYRQATENYNQSVRNYNDMLESTKLTYPAALDIFYSVGQEHNLFKEEITN